MASDYELLAKFLPKFIFHPDEAYFPCSIDYYLQNCQLYQNENLYKNIGQLTEENLSQLTFQGSCHYYYLKPQPIVRTGESDLSRVPIYAQIYQDATWIILEFIIFFPFMEHKMKDPMWTCLPRGSNPSWAQFKTVKIFIKQKTLQMHGMLLQDKFYKTNVPTIYISRYSHVFHIQPKIKKKWFSNYQETSSDTGQIWIPSFCLTRLPWQNYKGDWSIPS